MFYKCENYHLLFFPSKETAEKGFYKLWSARGFFETPEREAANWSHLLSCEVGYVNQGELFLKLEEYAFDSPIFGLTQKVNAHRIFKILRTSNGRIGWIIKLPEDILHEVSEEEI